MVDNKKEKAPVGGERVRVEPEVPTVESVRQAQDESPRREETPLEVESWITKIEKRLGRVPQGAPGPQDDQIVVQQPLSQQPPVKLSVNQQQLKSGQKLKPEFSLAWLVVWAIRQIKIMARLGRKVELAEIPETKIENSNDTPTRTKQTK